MNPLVKKLQIKPGTNWLVYNAPENFLQLIEPLPDGVNISYKPKGNFNGIQFFAKNNTELVQHMPFIKPLLKPDTVLWVIYPKKSSAIASDLNMMSSWDELTRLNLRPVASAAVDETWSAIRFKPIELTKGSTVSNANVQKSEFAQYVDVINKQITLPDDVAALLQQNSAALNNYQSLAYSHKKEYVLWILTAKQAKTREIRLVKMFEMLEQGKKNPADK